MVAVGRFVGDDEVRSAEIKSLRARLRVVASTLELDELPEHLRPVAGGISRELDERVFRPLLAAPDSPEACTKAFETFMDLWPALLSTLSPWVRENPERASNMARLATNAWSSSDALKLGADACYWFALAQAARTALAEALMMSKIPSPFVDEAAAMRSCLMADFAIMFGLFIMHADQPIHSALAVQIGKFAYTHAREAHALATAHLINPDIDTDRLLSEVKAITARISARTNSIVDLTHKYREKWRSQA